MKLESSFRRIFVNTFAQIIAKAITVTLGFLTIGILTRYLGVDQYGVYNLVFAYLAFFGILADFGLRLTLVKDLTGEKSKVKLKSAYFTLQIFLIILSTFLSIIFLFLFPYSLTTKMAIIVGSVAVGVGYMNGYGVSVLQSKVRLDISAILEIINRVVTVIAIVSFIWLKWNIYAIISAILIGNIATLIINICIAPGYFRLRGFPSFALLFSIVKSSFPVGITILFSMLYFKVDTMMLSIMKTTADVGIYSLAYKIFENIIIVWLLYMASLYPLISNAVNTKNRLQLKALTNSSLLIALGFSIFLIIASWLMAPLAIDILGGNDFMQSVAPFRILIFALPLIFINNIHYYLLISLSRIWSITLILFLALVFNFVINLYIIPSYGYIGTSISTVITEICTLIGYSLVLRKCRHI